MKIKDILSAKGNDVKSILTDKTVQDAIQMLVDNRIGSLVVMDAEGKVVGIITERDILRLSKQFGPDMFGKKVGEVMTTNLIVCEGKDDIEYAEKVMIEKRIRHLPILENGRLIGLISIGDIVKTLLKDSKIEIKYLRDYVEGNYPG
ncbi:MAG: CBS domain-containing protein [Calditrichia bacterium]